MQGFPLMDSWVDQSVPPVISKRSAGHFYRFARFSAAGRDIEINGCKFHTKHSAYAFAMLLVTVTFRTSQMKIAMCGENVTTGFLKGKQQCHRVGTPAQPHDYTW